MTDRNNPESVVPVSRRSVLRAGAATAVGVGLFSGTASATNPEQIAFCGCSELCLERDSSDPGGTFYVQEARWTGEDWEFDQAQYQGEESFCHRVDGDWKIIAVRPRNSDDRVYCNPHECAQDALEMYLENRDKTCVNDGFDTYNDINSPGTVEIVDCCIECESGEELLAKYEWEDGEFVLEGDGDDGVSLVDVTLDEDGEPQRACFTTRYCDLDAVVKAANEYETTEASNDDDFGVTEFCVTEIDGKAISNIRFYCEAPDDVSVGKGRGRGR